jgi:AraC-type transcriptional regulator N-terminus
MMYLDSAQLCSIIAQTNPGISKLGSLSGLFISDDEPSLIDCAIRLTQLLDTPQDIHFLAPMISAKSTIVFSWVNKANMKAHHSLAANILGYLEHLP